MNIWKVSTILSTSALVFVLGRPSLRDGVTPAFAWPQPNMEAALGKLREARGLLERAEHNKNGHRAKAIEFADVAIREAEIGIREGNEGPRGW